MLHVGWLVLLCLLLSGVRCSSGDEEPALKEALNRDYEESAVHLKTYRAVFAAKRKEQIETANKILAMPDYSKQYKIVNMLMETVFPAINESWAKLNASDYQVGVSPFPAEKAMQEVVGVVHEGVILFGDVLLRLPEMVKKVYRSRTNEWRPILEWSMSFCNQSTYVFTGPHAKQLHLMAQELGLIPEDPDYVNPFRVKQQDMREDKQEENKQKPKKTTKSKKTKGPKLRTNRRSEL